MAIQTRRGNEADFDASKMLPGEWAVSLDTRYVRMCFSPGIVLRMATYEGFESEKAQIQAILAECKTIQSAVQRIQAEVNSKASLVVEYSDSAKKSADRAYSEAERAKTYANNAEAVTGVNIATQDRAGLVKGGDNYIAEDGTLTLIKQTAETTMPNSYSGRLKVDEIGGGESQQFTTSGANLLPNTASSTTVNGVTFTVNTDGTILVNGTATADTPFVISYAPLKAGNYILSGCPNGGAWNTYSLQYNFGKQETGDGLEIALDNDGTPNIRILVSNGATVNNALFKPMVRLASITDATYEPYTGGIPSPNPSYPQEIKKTVISEIRTHGKNLLNVSPCIYGNINASGEHTTNMTNMISDYIKSNGEIYVSTNANVAGIGIAFYDANKSYLNRVVATNTNQSSSQKVDGCEYVRVWFGISNITTEMLASYEPMLNEGTEALPYEPYTESVITLSQPIELYGIGDVQDVIDGGKVKRKFVHVVYDGDENWKASSSLVGRYYLDNVGCKNYGFVLCSHANGIRGSSVEVNVCYVNTVSNPNGRFNINTPFDTVEEWKAHLASNPMTLVFELATETTEELPIADQIALNSLSTYDGITYLEFDSEIEPTFKGEYGTSKVGGYTLEGMLAGRNGELMGNDYANRITALEATVVNNI